MSDMNTSAPNDAARFSRQVGRLLALVLMAEYVTEGSDLAILDPIRKRLEESVELERKAHLDSSHR